MIQLVFSIGLVWAFGYVVASFAGDRYAKWYLAWWKRRYVRAKRKLWPKYKKELIWFLIGMFFAGLITP